MGWLVGTYVLISLAEILVSPMGLSYCTKVAPKRLGGLVMGGWFASLAAGGYLSGYLASRLWDGVPHSTYFSILMGGMLAVSVLLLVVRGVLQRAAR
jgi:POT family proton-dependent oligopeptide transporter